MITQNLSKKIFNEKSILIYLLKLDVLKKKTFVVIFCLMIFYSCSFGKNYISVESIYRLI